MKKAPVQLCAGLLLTNSIGYDSWPIPSDIVANAISELMAAATPR